MRDPANDRHGRARQGIRMFWIKRLGRKMSRRRHREKIRHMGE